MSNPINKDPHAIDIDALVSDLNEVLDKHKVYLEIEPYVDDNFIYVTHQSKILRDKDINPSKIVCMGDFDSLRT